MTFEAYLALALFVVANGAAASSGAIFRPAEWYKRLDKPNWRPPDWLFGPVWMILYAMIAISGWLVWYEAGLAGAALPLAIYAVQLILNAAWSALFFGLKRPDWALVDVVGMWLAIVATIFAFLPVHAGAAYLLIPYLVWVSFASVLNYAIVRRNPRAAQA
jgi:tryptophan-rich sensory protein